MSVATDEGYKHPQTGQQIAVTEWHNIETKGRLAEICMEYLKSGSKAYFEGKNRSREYIKGGVKHYFHFMACREMTMLDSKGADSMGGYQDSYSHPAQYS
jgi:single-strand DNA-binding protein